MRASSRQRLAAAQGRLQALDPHHVLRRGYAWLSDAGGGVVASVAQLEVGQRLRAVLSDGSAGVAVTDVRRDD